ncbi:hypothetical protein GRI97_14690 [Altererythrobacter xixiisoli]|uniref:Uncharacterized protein n=1 Tax=Croceibacterium xixiisoli TaxID=1476466 RepID=A0A6I4U043_9SPHN|nr:hypothetical protein [Croceibacterium xixiisoli]MXP00239.1 hypothetical protein [Croceibacterium xixiisoli]
MPAPHSGKQNSENRMDRLFNRAEAILYGRKTGLGAPILWHLALRHHGRSMLEIANHATRTGARSELGTAAQWFSPFNLMYRAYRLGEPNAAQNLAMTHFNFGDLQGYRHWIRKAARAGETNAQNDARRFELRQPYTLARRLRRLRPVRRDGS